MNKVLMVCLVLLLVISTTTPLFPNEPTQVELLRDPDANATQASPLGNAAEKGEATGKDLRLWSVIPFVLTLLSIALLPLVAHHWWENHLNKGIIALIFGLPVLIYIGMIDYHELLHQGFDYASFIILLGSLYIISGGIHLKGSLAGTPLVNTLFLAIGAVLASFIGTTGASMVLIRPLLRANRVRKRKVHIVIFFIFLVSNIGGCLTPLGDPPLFLGFLKGVPFLWTFNLWEQWAFVCGILLILFNLIDQWIFNKEDIATPGALPDRQAGLIVPNESARGESLRDPEAVSSGASPFGKDVEPRQSLSLEGKRNLLFLVGIMATVFCSGQFKWPGGIREAIMVAITGLAFVCTPNRFRKSNEFTFNPIIEVAVIFAGIFATMIPALMLLHARGSELGLSQPWHFFWMTGSLSSFLDNAPTYLALTATACSVAETPMTLLHINGETLLIAISLGAVFMGANTYIGNAPNFMVKAIAEESGIKMPSFFGYMLYSLMILIPIFVLVTIVFLR